MSTISSDPVEMPVGSQKPAVPWNILLGWALPILIVLLGFIYWIAPMLLYPPAPENAPMPVNSAIEQKYGVRITQVAITADGGMVDLRYVVLDPEKAHLFGTDPKTTPVLYPQANHTIVTVTAAMPHKDVLQTGTTSFLLYQDAQGSIKAHTYITLVLGDLKMEKVPVR